MTDATRAAPGGNLTRGYFQLGWDEECAPLGPAVKTSRNRVGVGFSLRPQVPDLNPKLYEYCHATIRAY
jgi:hypothetical protein